jgi:eukaryotic-like serine/threonine-protein kinase
LTEMYLTNADPGLHAAAEWLLRTWDKGAWLKQVNDGWAKGKKQRTKRLEGIGQALAKDKEKAPPQWYVNMQGQTMVVIPGPVEFLMGSPPTEAGQLDQERQHKRRIGRNFAVDAKAVTLAEFQRFDPEYGGDIKKYAPTGVCPVLGTTWFQAAEYCNWLSKQEGLPDTEWCYEPLVDPKSLPALAASSAGLCGSAFGPLSAAPGIFPGRTDPEFKAGMRLAPNYLRRTGYRLPTEAEMEFITRAGALTSRYYGETEDLLPKYSWYFANGKERSWPVGSMKPNDFGFFDAQGNVFTWCQEAFSSYYKEKDDKAIEDSERNLLVDLSSRVLRGGSFINQASSVRSSYRDFNAPSNRSGLDGFRVVRTLPLGSFTALPATPEGGRK